MAFVNASLLFGGMLMAIPVILHLAMRQKPRHLVFPAIRFIQQRRESNRRTLRLRHWLLLLLRALLILLLAAALARPSVDSNHWGNWVLIGLVSIILLLVLTATIGSWMNARGWVMVALLLLVTLLLAAGDLVLLARVIDQDGEAMLGDQEAPVAAVLVIDSSQRMGYQHENLSRLEQAQQTANWLIQQLPADSEVAVLGSSGRQQVFAIDLAAARETVERIQLTSVGRRLADVVRDGIDLLETSGIPRKEIYIFSDMTQGAWQESSQLKKVLEQHGDVLVYLVDEGATEPVNFAVGPVTLSQQTLTTNGTFQLRTELQHIGPGGEREIELYLEEPDLQLPIFQDGRQRVPFSVRRARQHVVVSENARQQVQFQLQGLSQGIHQGSIRLVGDDGLAIDDTRYFTIRVRAPWQVLVVAPGGVPVKFFIEAISPFSLRQTGQSQFVCTVIRQEDAGSEVLGDQQLEDFAAICLVDPLPLAEKDLQRLVRFSSQGGGVGLLLGHNASADGFDSPLAQQMLGGRLLRQWRPAGSSFLDPVNETHPVMTEFREMATSVPWQEFPVYRYWQIELAEGAVEIIRFANSDHPAMIEQRVGQGRTITMTTPVSEPFQITGRQPWNELVSGENAWPYFILINQVARQLVSSGESRLNYLAGETAMLTNDSKHDADRYQLFAPQGEPQPVNAVDGRLTVKFTEDVGPYRLKGERNGPVIRGFSVNGHAHQSQLARVTREQLDQILGAERYQLARGRSEIQFGVRQKRLGQEFFPLLMLLVAIVLALEHVLANRFYGRLENPDAAGTVAAGRLGAT